MKNKVISTAYAPLQPPYQVINYDHNVAMQIGTLIVTIQKDNKSVFSEFEIETHSYPVVAYENKNYDKIANNQLTQNRFLEGAVWNKVEIKEVTTLCLAGATLSWLSYMEILEHISSLNCYRGNPDVGLYWQLNKFMEEVI